MLPLMQRRELKWICAIGGDPIDRLPLMQRRELKYIGTKEFDSATLVASHVEV